MNYYAKAVMWMGLVLIALNLYASGGWSYIWGILSSKASTAPPHQ